MVHVLWCSPVHFEAILQRGKKFEIRKNDRAFKVGDLLLLSEEEAPQGSELMLACRVTYILEDCSEFGLDPAFCIMSFDIL